jgi:hypothetical protein
LASGGASLDSSEIDMRASSRCIRKSTAKGEAGFRAPPTSQKAKPGAQADGASQPHAGAGGEAMHFAAREQNGARGEKGQYPP